MGGQLSQSPPRLGDLGVVGSQETEDTRILVCVLVLVPCSLMVSSWSPQPDTVCGAGLQWALWSWQGQHDRPSGPGQEGHPEQG